MFGLLDQDIESLVYIIKLIVMMAIINTDIKDKLLEYHFEKGRSVYGYEDRFRNRRVRFPDFISVWHD
jgi:hypothetical protein